MQALPSHSQRQLVSGKVGWGWRQATYPISVNFSFAGVLIIGLSIAQLLRINDSGVLPMALFIIFSLLILGFCGGIYAASSVVEGCRQNSAYVFSQWQSITIVAYWLVLVAGLSFYSENSIKNFISIWWILPAAIFIGIATSLMLRSHKAKSGKTHHLNEAASADVLNIVTYSDRTVLVSPSSLGQQPRQFNSLVLMVLGLFFWTMLDFSNSIRAIASIIFTVTGLTGFFTWQAQLRSPEKILHLKLSGLWGMAADYAIDLRPFSRLSIVKLQEASGELSWMQLAGNNSEITMPLAMTMLAEQPKNGATEEDQLSQTLREEFHLAKQETECDSLSLAHVLLPQGAGILAGTSFSIIGAVILLVFPLPSQFSASSEIAWLGVCFVSPAIARFFLQLVAPSSLQSERLSHITSLLQPWEIGAALLLIGTFLSSTTKIASLAVFHQALPLITLICGWLSISIGVCILAFVRRTPLWRINY